MSASTLLGLLVVVRLSLTSAGLVANFNSSCDIHTINLGHVTPPQSLPMNGDKNWLWASKSDIKNWYDQGLKECNEFLEKNKESMGGEPGVKFAPYIDLGNIAGAGQTKCRGRDTLYALTGTIVWPFGPYSSCPTYSKCWFGLLTCGSPKTDFIRQQQLQLDLPSVT